jgi:hypothetical protein
MIKYLDEKELIESSSDKDMNVKEEFYQSRRKNFGVNFSRNEISEKNVSENSPKLNKNKTGETEYGSFTKKRLAENSTFESDIDNCNVYLKPNNFPTTRKGSAFKFLEEKMKNNQNNIPVTTVKSKEQFNDKIIASSSANSLPNNTPANIPNSSFNNPPTNLNSHFMPNNNSNSNTNINKLQNKISTGTNMINVTSNKIPITSQNSINNNQQLNEKKSEFQSRRKNIANIINELDGKVIDINLNSTANNKSEIDKNDHHINYGRKNVNTYNVNSKSEKDMLIGEGGYNKKTVPNGNSLNPGTIINNSNNAFPQNSGGSSVINNDNGVAINFASRRHVNNPTSTGSSNNLTANHSNQNTISRHQLNKENNNVNSLNSDKLRYY